MIGVSVLLLAPGSTLLNGFVGGWDLNGNANDVLGQNNGTPINTPIYSTGLGGQQALQTFGTDPSGAGYIQINTFPSAQIRPTAAITTSMWVKFTSYPPAGVRIFSDFNQDAASTRWILGYSNGTNLNVVLYTPGVGDTIVFIEDLLVMGLNTWHHVAFTWDGTTIWSYIDGVAKTAYSRSGALHAGINTPLSIGTQFNSGQANIGFQQNCYIWNRALTAGEIAALYNLGNVKRYPF